MNYIVHGILQARILEWVAFPFSRGSSQLRYQTQVSHIAGRFLYCLSQMWNACRSNPRSHGILTPFRLRPGCICVYETFLSAGKGQNKNMVRKITVKKVR